MCSTDRSQPKSHISIHNLSAQEMITLDGRARAQDLYFTQFSCCPKFTEYHPPVVIPLTSQDKDLEFIAS